MELGLSLVLCVFCAAVIKTEGRTQQGVSQGMAERGERGRGREKGVLPLAVTIIAATTAKAKEKQNMRVN